MFMNKKTQYCQGVNSYLLNLYIQGNSNRNPSKLFGRYLQIDSKISRDIEEQNWRTDTT